MKILHNIYSVGPESFGLGPVALNLCQAQNAIGNDAAIWCHDNAEDVRWAELSYGLPPGCIRSFPCKGPNAFKYSPMMERAAFGAGRPMFDVVHQHCLWLANSRITSRLGERFSIPSIIAPHGSLEPWALQRSRWKKKLALCLYEKRNLKKASCLHALSAQEVAGFRAFGLNNPVAVIPNGISQSWLESDGNAAAFRSRFNIAPEKRVILFLSRITPIKGIPLLIESLAQLHDTLTDWMLVLAGADEFGHLHEVQKLIGNYGLHDSVLLTGVLKDQIKRDAFAAAELFVLPTKREAAPIVVLEALGAGVPVVTTKGAPWENLKKYDCGWWTDIDSDAIAEALKEAISCSPERLKSMGQRGKKLVSTQYTWARSAQMTIELYEWLLGQKERPDFVLLD